VGPEEGKEGPRVKCMALSSCLAWGREDSLASSLILSLPSPLVECRYTLELMSGRQLGATWASEEAGKNAECLARRNSFRKTSEVREGGREGRKGGEWGYG